MPLLCRVRQPIAICPGMQLGVGVNSRPLPAPKGFGAQAAIEMKSRKLRQELRAHLGPDEALAVNWQSIAAKPCERTQLVTDLGRHPCRE
jgi:hypothetical protein